MNGLSPAHREDLHRSGLIDATITLMAVSSVRPQDLDRLAGWDITARGVTSALCFPYPGCDGFYQLKVFPAFTKGDGHQVRYIQPRGSAPRLYVLPPVRERLQDPCEPVLVVEGVKKAARLVQEGFTAVGIAAVWNWKAGGEAVPFTDPACLLPDLRAVATPGRWVFLCFDSDIWLADRGNCRLACYALGQHLERAGCIARAVRLPIPTPDEQQAGVTKIGADDYLLRHSKADFDRLLEEAVPLTAEVFTDAAQVWVKKEQATRPFAEPISALLSEPDAAPDWLVENLIALGDGGFVAAEPKVAKSWLLCLLALCLTTAQPFLGFKVPQRRKVLLVSEEDSRSRLRRRLRQLIAGLDGNAPTDEWLRFTARTGFKFDSVEWLARLRDELAVFRPDVVLLDVLRRLHDMDENSNKDMGKLTNVLNDLRRDYGCGFVLAHHNRKLTQGNAKRSRGGQEMSGAGVLHGWSEAALYLAKGSGKGNVVVTPEHKDTPEMEPFIIRLEDCAGAGGQKAVRIINEGPATVDKGAETRKRILEVLSSSSGKTAQELAKALGFHVNTVKAHLKALAADGAVHKKGIVKQADLWWLSTKRY